MWTRFSVFLNSISFCLICHSKCSQFDYAVSRERFVLVSGQESIVHKNWLQSTHTHDVSMANWTKIQRRWRRWRQLLFIMNVITNHTTTWNSWVGPWSRCSCCQHEPVINGQTYIHRVLTLAQAANAYTHTRRSLDTKKEQQRKETNHWHLC